MAEFAPKNAKIYSESFQMASIVSQELAEMAYWEYLC